MKKLYEKSALIFSFAWIAIYCVLQSLAYPLNEIIGIEYAASAVFCFLQATALFMFIKKNGLLSYYGICKTYVPARRFLYYIPLLVLMTRNFWNGAAVNFPLADTVCYIVCMLCVGFVEEVIFRGFLFKAIARDNETLAIIISSCHLWPGPFTESSEWQRRGIGGGFVSGHRSNRDRIPVCHLV